VTAVTFHQEHAAKQVGQQTDIGTHHNSSSLPASVLTSLPHG